MIMSENIDEMMNIPRAKQVEVNVTDYMRSCLDKVAISQGFKNYSVEVILGSSIGDGFVGVIFKVLINENDNSGKSLTVVLKTPPENQTRRIQFGSMDLFRREIFMYNEVLPEFVKLQKEQNISDIDGFFNFPKVFYAEYNEEIDDAIIIMEDLRERGLKMWDKFKPTNYEHAKLVMIALGKFHALSMAMKLRKPDIFEKFKSLDDYFTRKFSEPASLPMFDHNISQAANTLDTDDVKRRECVMKLLENFAETLQYLTNPKNAEPFAVVNHGDCWSNNFMYQYQQKNDSPEKIYLLDFQVSRYCSPVLDLVYFLFSCTSGELRESHFNELLEIYHKTLEKFLKSLIKDDFEFEFPFEAFLSQMKEFGRFGILMATMIIPIVTTQNEDLPDFDYMAEKAKDFDPNEPVDPEIIKKMMANMMKVSPAYTTRMRESLIDAINYEYLGELDLKSKTAATIEVPKAKLAEIHVTDYMKNCLDKVAIAEGFKNYDIKVIHGSAIGDGFVGIIFKVLINEKDNSGKSLNLVLKTPPENLARRIQFDSLKMFKREIFMYNEVIPEFVKFQKEMNIPMEEGAFDFPKVYFAEYNEEIEDAIMIMEDLRERGFKLWDKFTPTNYEHAKLVMSSLGKFHAVSMGMKLKKPEIFEKFKGLQDYFTEKFTEPQAMAMWDGTITQAADSLDPSDIERRNRVLKLKENFGEQIKELTDPKNAEPYAVINHGDCWSNNFMYQYDGETPNKICLLDLQISRYCTPVLDLVYFIFSCTSGEMRSAHFCELLTIYHKSLENLLNKLTENQLQFPFEEFLGHMKKFGKFGIYMATFLISIVTTKNEELPDFDFIAENSATESGAPDMEKMKDLMGDFMKASDAYNKRMSESIIDAINYEYL